MNNLSNDGIKEVVGVLSRHPESYFGGLTSWEVASALNELLAYREAQGNVVAEIYAAPERDDAYRLVMKKLEPAYDLPKGIHKLYVAPQLPAAPEPVSNPYKLPDFGNSPVIPDGWALMPRKLTAENGAKGALSGEFLETKYISCPECFGDDDCESCDGSGRIKVDVIVSWDTIKRIYSSAIHLFCKEGDMLAAAPKPEVK